MSWITHSYENCKKQIRNSCKYETDKNNDFDIIYNKKSVKRNGMKKQQEKKSRVWTCDSWKRGTFEQ